MHEPILSNYQATRKFAALESNRSAMKQTAHLEQALAVADFRVDQDYDEICWSIYMTNYAAGNRQAFGCFL